MRRLSSLVIVLFAALSIAGTACGDGADDEREETATITAVASPSASPGEQTPPTLTPPDARGDDAIALTVVAGETTFQPTVAEFRALPQSSSGGLDGVSLDTLAAELGVEHDAVVTVEGRSSDFSQVRYWRGLLSEARDGLVLEMDGDGLIRLGGPLIEEGAWIYGVESVAIQ